MRCLTANSSERLHFGRVFFLLWQEAVKPRIHFRQFVKVLGNEVSLASFDKILTLTCADDQHGRVNVIHDATETRQIEIAVLNLRVMRCQRIPKFTRRGHLCEMMQWVRGARTSRPQFSASRQEHPGGALGHCLVRLAVPQARRRDADGCDRDGRAPQFQLHRSRQENE